MRYCIDVDGAPLSGDIPPDRVGELVAVYLEMNEPHAVTITARPQLDRPEPLPKGVSDAEDYARWRASNSGTEADYIAEREACDVCDGYGWIGAPADPHGYVIEACDTCKRYGDDLEAAAACGDFNGGGRVEVLLTLDIET